MEVLRASGYEREPSQAKSIARKLAQKRSELSTRTWGEPGENLQESGGMVKDSGVRPNLINLLATAFG
jgi:hypothetical protein